MLAGVALLRTNVFTHAANIIDVRTYRGAVAKRYPLKMNLRKDRNVLSGTYEYSKYKRPIRLSGKVGANGNITVYGYDRKGAVIEVFRGIPGAHNDIRGTMTRQRDKKIMPFQLSESGR